MQAATTSSGKKKKNFGNAVPQFSFPRFRKPSGQPKMHLSNHQALRGHRSRVRRRQDRPQIPLGLPEDAELLAAVENVTKNQRRAVNTADVASFGRIHPFTNPFSAIRPSRIFCRRFAVHESFVGDSPFTNLLSAIRPSRIFCR